MQVNEKSPLQVVRDEQNYYGKEFPIIPDILQIPNHELGLHAKIILCMIIEGSTNGISYITNDNIARRLGMAKSKNISTYINQLIDGRYISRKMKWIENNKTRRVIKILSKTQKILNNVTMGSASPDLGPPRFGEHNTTKVVCNSDAQKKRVSEKPKKSRGSLGNSKFGRDV